MFILTGVIASSLPILPVGAKRGSISGFIITTQVVYLTAMFLLLNLYNVDQMHEFHSPLFHEKMFSRPLRITTEYHQFFLKEITTFTFIDVQYIV